jgi:AhpD family alkylhydroperoxidase
MRARLNYAEQSPELAKRLNAVAIALEGSAVERSLRDLVVLRASQINHCAFCVDMHVKAAKLHGERELRLHHVAVWRESPLFTDKEKAALEWSEAVTLLAKDGVSDALFARVREHFSEKEISDLTFVIGLINFWNRLSVSFSVVPGSMDQAFGLDKAGLK